MEIFGYAIGVVGLVIGILSWIRPKPQGGNLFRKYKLDVSNIYPLYDPPNEYLTKHYVSVTLRNRSGFPIRVTSWGFKVPSGGTIVSFEQPTWAPKLPMWLEARSSVSLVVLADELRQINSTEKIQFKDMRAWIELADGTRVKTRKGVPLE